MLTPPDRRRRIEVEDVGQVSIVSFLDRRILDEQNIQIIGDDLFRLVDELGRRQVLLDFSNVEFLSTALLGKLITLLRKLQAGQGRLLLCNLDGTMLDVFKITKIDRILTTITHPDLLTARDVLHEVWGDPLNPVAFSPDWRTDTVLALARQIRESSEYGTMPILADSLQDAGCDAEYLLAHLRDVQQPHVKECWALDQVLPK